MLKHLKSCLKVVKQKVFFVNIFGGINRCDKVAEGIVKASQLIDLNVPIVVRLEGTNVEEGREIFEKMQMYLVLSWQNPWNKVHRKS